MAQVGKKMHRYPLTTRGLSREQDRLWILDEKPRRIYVAAPLPNQLAALRFAIQLQDCGFTVTSRWLRADFGDRPPQSRWYDYVIYEDKYCAMDLEDLAGADTLVILADQPSSTGGYHVELGHFLGSGKRNIIAVGDRPNVFFFADNVRWTKTTIGLVEWLLDESHGTREVAPHVKEYIDSLKAGPEQSLQEKLGEMSSHVEQARDLNLRIQSEQAEQNKLKAMADLVLKVPPGIDDEVDEGTPI